MDQKEIDSYLEKMNENRISFDVSGLPLQFRTSKNQFNKGLIFTSLGSFWWGFIGVLYFEYVSFIGHIELVVHRCLWTAVMLIFTTFFFSKWKIFFEIVSNKINLIGLFFSGSLIFINWAVWIYAVATDRTVSYTHLTLPTMFEV